MSLLAIDPFSQLGIPRNAGHETIKTAYSELIKNSTEDEKIALEKTCGFLLSPKGRSYARMAGPVGGKSFSQLKNSLPARPRYLGPGKWKKVLNGLLKEEEYTS